ncbi:MULTISPECIES: DUF6502 family protein [unclassified Rhizobacter]|uniref:DUF6502 family protein n=1 Tax=unclassified Rhizobacter TaxID=2640088 RepID=UPI0006FA7D6B|nr:MULTISPECIES: DUF6502 family protein [unclassified Rhizobacter]KQU81074.1 hypothetical protein ASC88_16255 [Rhizobacter sp. Root29]KQW04618.1 hypothetical protein ASC98_05945 [Rhizobacter sp. Root1238]KRB06461.1 hypothetical protein ASE08_12505 [Rhizobacter sp. Root16D2]
MNQTIAVQNAVASAITRVLRPLVRLLLRHSIPFAAFQELAKHVYVEVVLQEFALPGKKASISRASILTGLSRKDVQRLLESDGPDSAATAQEYNRAARVLTGWIRDAEYLDRSGEPLPIEFEGERSFATLVKRYSGDMPARAVLDELLRVGAIGRREDGLIEPLQRAYVPQAGVLEKLSILGRDTSDLIDTIDHNIQHGSTDPRYQRKVMYDGIPSRDLGAFRKLSAAKAQALLETLDSWLAAHDVDDEPGEPSVPRSRVGLGIYYFEEPLTAPDTQRGST